MHDKCDGFVLEFFIGLGAAGELVVKNGEDNGGPGIGLDVARECADAGDVAGLAADFAGDIGEAFADRAVDA